MRMWRGRPVEPRPECARCRRTHTPMRPVNIQDRGKGRMVCVNERNCRLRQKKARRADARR